MNARRLHSYHRSVARVHRVWLAIIARRERLFGPESEILPFPS
jgi:hypothetical protein